MKVASISKTLFTFLTLVTVGGLTSCEKNDIDDNGQFHLKVVNLSPTAGPQTFTLAGTTLVNSGLDFNQSSDYITSPSGTRLVAEYRSLATNILTAKGEIWTANTIYQTIYLAGQGSNLRVKVYTDDMGASNSGRAKVKFIDFSDNGPSSVDVRDANGNELVNNLSRNDASSYKSVDPGDLIVQLTSANGNNTLGTFTVPGLTAGKIYTIYFTDGATGSIIADKVLHN